MDVTTPLLQLRDAGADSLLVFASSGYGHIYNNLKTIGWHPLMIVPPNAFAQELNALGPLVQDDLLYSNVVVKSGASLDPGLTALMTLMANKGISFPGLIGSAMGINDALLMVKYAIEKTNTLDGPTLRNAIEGSVTRASHRLPILHTFSPAHHVGITQIFLCSLNGFGQFGTPIQAG